MANAVDYITLTEAKAALNIATSTHDTEIEAWTTAVSQQLDKYVGPVVQRTVTSESHDGGGATLFLKNRPVASVTAAVEYSATTPTTLSAESAGTQPGSAYLLEGNGVLRRRSGGGDARFPAGRKNVIVTYVAGRASSTSTVDEKFKTAARMCLAHLWRREQGFGSETFGSPGTFPGLPGFGLPNVVVDLLADEAQAPEVA